MVPFFGLVQVACTEQARALSLDGRNWAIHYALEKTANSPTAYQGIDSGPQHALVATIEAGQLKTCALHPFLEPIPVRSAVDSLFAAVSTARLPFVAADHYEYWLMDGSDGGSHRGY